MSYGFGKTFLKNLYLSKRIKAMKKVFLTLLVTLVIIISGFLIYIYNGFYDVSQLTPHNDITKYLIRKTKRISIKNRMTKNVVPGNINDTIVLISGFKLYNKMSNEEYNKWVKKY